MGTLGQNTEYHCLTQHETMTSSVSFPYPPSPSRIRRLSILEQASHIAKVCVHTDSPFTISTTRAYPPLSLVVRPLLSYKSTQVISGRRLGKQITSLGPL